MGARQSATTPAQCVDTPQGGRDVLSPALNGSRRCVSFAPVVYENLGGSAEFFRKLLRMMSHTTGTTFRCRLMLWMNRHSNKKRSEHGENVSLKKSNKKLKQTNKK